MFDGSYLEETVATSKDPSKDEEQYRWPVRFNLARSYCLTHAGLLWGRGQTGQESADLFNLRVDPKVPGRPGPPAKAMAQDWQETLEYFWSFWQHILRSSGATQQWAGGCILKANWNPGSPNAVFGVVVEQIEPENYYPIWDPVNYDVLLGVKLRFFVSQAVAIEKYGFTEAQVEEYARNNVIEIEEYWDRHEYWVAAVKGKDKITAHYRKPNGDVGDEMKGDNPWVHPRTKQGMIPFVYIPRIRTMGYFGDSLVRDLEGLQAETNKTLADFGDALTRATHPTGAVSDFRVGKKRTGGVPQTVTLPKGAVLNLGITPPGGQPGKYTHIPAPEVPDQTPKFMETLLALAEQAGGLTPAARGQSQGDSSLAMAFQMLPTTNQIDWSRSHWANGLCGRAGLCEILGVIWYNRRDRSFVPRVEETCLDLRLHMICNPVIPKDRVATITEVVQLMTAEIIPPQEALKRLGDIENIEEILGDLYQFLVWKASVEAAVAGRGLTFRKDPESESPALPVPEVSGDTAEEKPKRPAKQPEGQGAAK